MYVYIHTYMYIYLDAADLAAAGRDVLGEAVERGGAELCPPLPGDGERDEGRPDRDRGSAEASLAGRLAVARGGALALRLPLSAHRRSPAGGRSGGARRAAARGEGGGLECGARLRAVASRLI